MTHSVVIGGAGFVGSWVVEELLKNHDSRITIIDNLISSERWNLSKDPRITFIEGSAAVLDAFDKVVNPVDQVFQLACFHGNQSSIARPLEDLENGLKTTLVALEWIKNYNPSSRLIYAGAGCALAEKTWNVPNPTFEIESTSLIHDSPYSISKVSGEMYCLFYLKQFNVDVVRVRFQNIYGPREILGAGTWRGTENTIWRNVIPTFIYKSLRDLDIEIHDQFATRDFTYVEDVARSVCHIAKNAKQGSVYNIASGTETNILNLAEIIVQASNSNSKILLTNRRSWDSSGRRYGDTTRLNKELNQNLDTPLRDGLRKTIRWTEANLAKIEESIRKHSNVL